MFDPKTLDWPFVLTSNISLVKGPLGLRRQRPFWWEGWKSFQLVNVCLHLFLHLFVVREWAHLWFMKLILVQIHRDGCLCLFLWSHLFYTVQTYSTLAHTPPCERPQIWVIFSARKGGLGGLENCCWYLYMMTKIKVCVLLLLPNTLAGMWPQGATVATSTFAVRAPQGPRDGNLAVWAARMLTAAPGTLCCLAKHWSGND